jgi:hypothetical protein
MMPLSTRISYGDGFLSAVEQFVRLDQCDQAAHTTGVRLLVDGGQSRRTY